MIIVKIELWSAVTRKATEIGRMHIINDGTGNMLRRNYKVEVVRRGATATTPDGAPAEAVPVTRRGEVRAFPSLSYNVWRLVTRALLSAFPEESIKDVD